MIRRIRFLLVAAVALATCLSLPAAMADSSIRVKVVVNDQIITTFDIAQRVRLMSLAREKGGEKEAIEQLINETLEMADAKRRGFTIPEAQVERAFASIAQGMKTNAAQLSKMLLQAGVQPETLKRRIRVQMTWAQLVQARQRATSTVKATDVTAKLLAESKAQQMTMTEFRLQQIIFVVPEKSSPAYIAQRRKEAEAFRLRFAGCDKSLDMAKGLKDVVVRDLGRRTAGDLAGKQGDDVKATPVGKATPSLQTSLGVEIIGVCSSREIQSDAEARAEVESKMSMEQSKDVGADYLKELRKTAVIQMR
jgi:peptidyl-prolyl cis-trans isomerase SurA